MQQQQQSGGQPNSNTGQVQNLPQDPGDSAQQESNLDESNLTSAGVLLAHNGGQSHLQQQKQAQAQALLEQQAQQGIPTLRPQLHPNSRFLHSGQGSPMAASQQQGMHLSGPQVVHGLTRTASGQRLAQMAASSYNPSGLYQLGSSPSGGGLVSSPQMHSGQQPQHVGPRGTQASMQQQGLVTSQQRGSQSSLQPVSGQGVGQPPPMMSMPNAQQQMPGMQPQQPSAAQQANLQGRMKSSGMPPQMQSGGSTYQGMQPMGASLSGPQPSRPAGNIAQQQQQQQRILHSAPKFQQQQQSAMSPGLTSSMQPFSMTGNLVQQSTQQQEWVPKQQGVPSPSYQAQYGMQRPTVGQQAVQHQQHHLSLHQQYLTSNHKFGSSPVSQGLPQGHFQSHPPSQPQQSVSMTHLAPPSQQLSAPQPLSQTSTVSEAHSQSQLQAPSSHLPPQTQPASAQGYGSYQSLVSQHMPQQPRLQPSPIAKPAVQPGTPMGGQPLVAERRVLGKRRVQQLLAEIDPLEQLDPDAEDVLLEFVDHFIDTVARSSCDMAKHRKAGLLDVDDVLLPLNRTWQIPVPGYEDFRPNRKPRKL